MVCIFSVPFQFKYYCFARNENREKLFKLKLKHIALYNSTCPCTLLWKSLVGSAGVFNSPATWSEIWLSYKTQEKCHLCALGRYLLELVSWKLQSVCFVLGICFLWSGHAGAFILEVQEIEWLSCNSSFYHIWKEKGPLLPELQPSLLATGQHERGK